MSCDGNRDKHFHGITGANSVAAQAFGGSDEAKQALDTLYEIGRSGPQPAAERAQAAAQTKMMFSHMQQAGIKPPVHSASGMPKVASQFGYALVQRTVTALERGEPLPPQARDLFVGRLRQIQNIRPDANGRVRCGSCGQFASPIRGHICARTANAKSLQRSLMRRLGVPPTAFPDQELETLLEAARKGSVLMKHPVTGEQVQVSLDALPMAMGNGFTPAAWEHKGRRVVSPDGAIFTVLSNDLPEAAAPEDAIEAAAAASGLQVLPEMRIIELPLPSAPASLEEAGEQARETAAALGFDDSAQKLLESSVRQGRIAPDDVPRVLDLALAEAVVDNSQILDNEPMSAALYDFQQGDLAELAAGEPSEDQMRAARLKLVLDNGLAPLIHKAQAGQELSPEEERRILEAAGLDDRAGFDIWAEQLSANGEEFSRLRDLVKFAEPGKRLAERERFRVVKQNRDALLKNSWLMPQRWVESASVWQGMPAPLAPPEEEAAEGPPPEEEAAATSSTPTLTVLSSPLSFAYGSDPTRAYQMRYRVIDLDELTPSNLDNGAINPEYDASLQPRQRDRVASQVQIENVAKKLTPDALLTDFKQLDKGAPIIGSEDTCVESGNGRVLALRKARDKFPERWQAYQERLRSVSTSFGVDAATLASMKSPVLVRERVEQVDRAAFAREANAPPVLQMSTLENAVVDARRLSDDTLLRLNVREDQSIDLALRAKANHGFVRDFMGTLPDNERAMLVRADGSLNQQGIWRIKAALFTRTFPGEAGKRLAETFTEALDSTTKNFEQAVAGTLPALVRAQSLIGNGQRSAALDMSADMAQALDMLGRLREQEMPVPVYLEQAKMFERELTPFQENLLRHFDKIGRSPKSVRKFLNAYAQEVEAAPHPEQNSMFGGTELTKEQLFFRIANASDNTAAETRAA